MRNLGLTFIMLFVFSALASASTINLNDGRTVQGNILNQDAKSVQVSVDGVAMTYYADEIKNIDGQPFTAAGAAPAAAASIPSVDSLAIDPQKKALILKFIDVFGTRQALKTNFAQMIAQIEKTKPEEAQKIRDRINVDEIIDRLLPVYDKNFTSDDLQSFINFYGSPVGQKLITAIPELMKESVQISIKYMEEKFPEVKSGQ